LTYTGLIGAFSARLTSRTSSLTSASTAWSAPNDSPLAGVASVHVSRRDAHNLEIKTVFESSSESLDTELELYFIMPKSFQLVRWRSEEPIQDVQTWVRFSIPTRAEHSRAAMDRACSLVRQAVELPQITELEQYERIQESGAMASEMLRHLSQVHKRKLFLA
jgi:hypothetical protein